MEPFVIASVAADMARWLATGVALALILAFWYFVMSRIGTF